MKKFAEKCIQKIKWCVSKITYKMIMLVIGIILLVIVYTSFKVNINHQINDNTKVYLSSVLDESLDRVGIKVNEEINILKTIAAIFNKHHYIYRICIDRSSRGLYETMYGTGILYFFCDLE